MIVELEVWMLCEVVLDQFGIVELCVYKMWLLLLINLVLFNEFIVCDW